MRRRMVIGALALMTMVLSSLVTTGCAYRRDDRSLVQPLALSKKLFTGEWYYMKTVYEAPYDSGFFNGQGGWPLGAKIRWEITERYLYAFNASPNIRNTDSAVTPLAAWRITRHFDIKARLNYATGEPSNIIVEEGRDGLPWYQRKYFRVLWEAMVISDWTDIFQTYAQWTGQMRFQTSYIPPQQFKVTSDNNYFSYVSEQVVNKMFNSYLNMAYLEIPMSTYRIKMRHSFRKVKASTYTAKEYNDEMFAKFGNFRTTVLTYHMDRGMVDWSYKFYANRHNLATKDDLASSDSRKNKPKKITYYLSPGFPAELMDAVKTVEKGWNSAFQYATQRTDTVFEIKANADGLAKGQKRDLGDLRYNYLWWVNVPQKAGLLGYGPSVADPDTGEIVHGSAYIYGAPLRIVTENYMTLYDMISGRYSVDDVVNSVEYFNAALLLSGYDNPLALATGSTQKMITDYILPTTNRNTNFKTLSKMATSAGFRQRMKGLMKLDQAAITARIARIDQHPQLKSTLMNDHFTHLAFPNMDSTKAMALKDPELKKLLERYHPANMARPHVLRNLYEDYVMPSKRNMYMASYADDALNTFVKYHVDKKTPREEVRKRIIAFLFVSVTAHELGHSFGLTHNFRGSMDEFNYHNRYHDLKDGKATAPCTNCPADMKNHEFFYRNASIMDYAGEYYDDSLGPGKTDRAAIAFIYNSLVEKKVNDPRKQGELIKWTPEIERRHKNPADPLKLRIFKTCSDYLVGQDPFCQRWDSGPTALGVVQNMIWNYDRTYPLRYFRRGRRSFNSNVAAYRNLFNMMHMSKFLQDWTYRVITQPDYKDTADFKDKLAAIERTYRFFLRLIATPRVAAYEREKNTDLWKISALNQDDYSPRVDVRPGVGRYMFSRLQQGYYGIASFRMDRVGIFLDKYYALLLLSTRSLGFYRNRVDWVYSNFYDIFKEDTTALMSQSITDLWQPNSPYLTKMKWTCKTNDDCDAGDKCTADPKAKKSYCGKTINLEPGWHPVLQYQSMFAALALVNNDFSNNTFTDYMRVGTQGNSKSWTPPAGAKVISFQNALGTRTYFAVQTTDGKSISWKLVEEGQRLSKAIKALKQGGINVNRNQVELLEGQLESVETALTLMQQYVAIFGG